MLSTIKKISLRRLFVIILTLLFTSISTHSFAVNGAPYNQKKFQNALKKSKLTYPKAENIVLNGAGRNTFIGAKKNNRFYLDGSDMVINLDGKKAIKSNRNELRRHGQFNWTSGKTMHGSFQVLNQGSKDFTILQVHSNKGHVPPIRVSAKGNNIVASFRRCLAKNCPTDSSFKVAFKKNRKYSFSIKVGNKKIYLNINGNKKTYNLDKAVKGYKSSTRWKKDGYYFKAGVYLQKKGSAKVKFQKLYW